MKTTRPLKNRHLTLRQAALRQIAAIGPFIEGSVCAVKRRGCVKPGWQVTFKKQGRTKTVYIPMDIIEEVKEWSHQFKMLKRLIRTVTTHSLGLLRGHVANRSAARRIKR